MKSRSPSAVSSWPLQDAKQRLSALVKKAGADGPQTITRHGVPAAVVVSPVTWQGLTERRRPTLKELLLAPADAPIDDLDRLIGRRAGLRFERPAEA